MNKLVLENSFEMSFLRNEIKTKKKSLEIKNQQIY